MMVMVMVIVNGKKNAEKEDKVEKEETRKGGRW